MALLDTAFPWIGLVAAIPLLALLAGNALRMDRSVARWRDWGWLSWAGVAAYLVHNVEEYGLDLHGGGLCLPQGLLRDVYFRTFTRRARCRGMCSLR
jgi:di/tricarboxylate transporter